MSSRKEEDPFLQVQQDVLAQMEQTRPLFTSYLRIRSLTTSATQSSPELASARSDLEAALATLGEDLADLVASVHAAEASPAQYGLSVHEVARRKRLVREIAAEVEDMRGGLGGTVGGAVVDGTAARAAAGDLPDPNAFAIPEGGDEDYAAEFEQRQQMAMMREQDEQLDDVFQTVGNLRRMANDMGREMEEQREMLEMTDSLVDRVGGRLQTGMDKMNAAIRHNEDRLSSWCIGLLIMVLCILLVLLLLI